MNERSLRLARAMVAIQVATVLRRLRRPVRNAMWMKPQPSHPSQPANLDAGQSQRLVDRGDGDARF
jgi:hypothetical protein